MEFFLDLQPLVRGGLLASPSVMKLQILLQTSSLSDTRVLIFLSPSVDDVRPFQWYRYGEASGTYRIDVRYTSYLDISDFIKLSDFTKTKAYQNSSSARRQQIRYAVRDGLLTEELSSIPLFLELYVKTLERQGEVVDQKYLMRMGKLITALNKDNLIRIFVSRLPGGLPGSIALFAIDHKRAYYLFGASDPLMRSTPVGTAVMWNAFIALAKSGVKVIDLEGVNSPRRGWFKTSFGGYLQQYYQISLNYNN